MSSLAFAQVQQALLDTAISFSTPVVCPQTELASQTTLKSEYLPPVLTDYLDTLLQNVAEDNDNVIREQTVDTFNCLHFVSANAVFLMPLSRIDRINYAEPKRLRFALQIPEYPCSGRFMIEVRNQSRWLFLDELKGLLQVQSKDIQWRPNAKRAPWFIGTHKTHLCRVFDPERMITAEIN